MRGRRRRGGGAEIVGKGGGVRGREMRNKAAFENERVRVQDPPTGVPQQASTSSIEDTIKSRPGYTKQKYSIRHIGTVQYSTYMPATHDVYKNVQGRYFQRRSPPREALPMPPVTSRNKSRPTPRGSWNAALSRVFQPLARNILRTGSDIIGGRNGAKVPPSGREARVGLECETGQGHAGACAEALRRCDARRKWGWWGFLSGFGTRHRPLLGGPSPVRPSVLLLDFPSTFAVCR